MSDSGRGLRGPPRGGHGGPQDSLDATDLR